MTRYHYLDMNEPPMDFKDKLIIGACTVACVVFTLLMVGT